ncbi:mannose-6-phosphate isomerase 1 [Prunus yedoensis var. nudiflora]|uniref:mannose-6-phosphate isomerase n=1 Tax=Prunus yedoensis var. nudiflora TaxID=2094558 RepID=A0A314ZGK7_PRUYE|nr:mannose-6-phosphate isomerase 1 [Prunus yedoensis var. nudiflora]
MEPWDKNMKKKRKRSRRPVRLRCSVKNYDWGIVGSHSKVARLFALNSGSDIDPAKPYAEFWIGTHESGPSYVDSRSEPVSLKAWIARDPSVLGDKVVDKWGADLPFLCKVLSVGKALSIQAHPDKELARVLHKLHPNVYRDDNHKPEMALALTEFEALCGFISVKELKDMLSSVPEIAELVGVRDAERILLVNEQHENGKSKTDLESIFSRVMLLSKDTISEMISKLKRRLNLEKKKRQLTVKEQLALRLESQYPADVGAIAAFFLNYVKLNRGEAISLGPNEPHAYISGECIECMATSDNVVRAGLTSKPLDVQTLLSMLKYRQGSPEILQGVSLNPYTTRYLPPFEEFEVDCCNLPQSAAVIFPSVLGPSLFLFTAGKGHFDAGLTEDDMVKEGDDIVEEGEVFFVPANTKISITAKSTELQLYRVGVNSKIYRDL